MTRIRHSWRLAAAAAAAVALAATVAGAAGEDECTWTSPTSGHSYDLNGMSRKSGEDYTKTIQVGPNIQFIYRLNICSNTLVQCQGQDAPATEALKIPAGETCRILGRLDGLRFSDLTVPITPSNPEGAGLALTYTNGDICDPTQRTTRSVTINVQCTTNEAEEGQITDVKKEGTCATTFTLTSVHGCPATSSSSSSLILILFAVAVALYLGVGGFLLHRNGARGTEMIPHYDFWKEVPGLVKDGCVFSYSTANSAIAKLRGEQ